MSGIKRITVEEADVIINYYLDLAKKLEPNDKRINKVKIRLGHWNRIKNSLLKNE